MGLIWKNTGKKVRKDAKNLFSDNRYDPKSSPLEGTDQNTRLIADAYNSKNKK